MNNYSQWFDACSPVQMHPRLRSGFPSRAIGLRAADAVLAKTLPPATGGTDGFTHNSFFRFSEMLTMRVFAFEVFESLIILSHQWMPTPELNMTHEDCGAVFRLSQDAD